MVIAIFSDSHDNTNAVHWALHSAVKYNATYGIHCGDITTPDTVQLLANAPFPFFCVFGNNDVQIATLRHCAQNSGGNLTFSDDHTHGTITLDNRSIFATHYPNTAHNATHITTYDAIFYGHTHRYDLSHSTNETIICNPGELYGKRTGTISFALYDTQRHAVRLIKKSYTSS